jgi:murein DD-endopeptidase MepM/ murein hydrolase activator NlpD
LVRKGKFVDRGDKIAKVGSSGRSTGPHLHFEIRKRENPVDPMLYLD